MAEAKRWGLGVAQGFLALAFVGSGLWKLLTPLPKLAAMMPWVAELPALFYATSVLDLLGGMGVALPTLTKIRPRLAAIAAAGLVVQMACAIVFHVSRGEAAKTPFNVVLLAVAAYVAWGRREG